MDPIEQRVAVNESLFRDVNKNIHRSSADGRHDEAQFICECGERTCEEKVPMAIDTYEAIRGNPLRFFVRPGHETPYAETVIDRHEAYVVVEKPPEARPFVGKG